MDLPSANLVEGLRRRQEVLGALMVGSAVRGTTDSKSDRDIEVVIEDDHYDRLLPAARIVRQVRDELFTVPARDFFQKKRSSRDVDHWPYQTCVLLYDRTGAIAE